jgi:hypothetical protein
MKYIVYLFAMMTIIMASCYHKSETPIPPLSEVSFYYNDTAWVADSASATYMGFRKETNPTLYIKAYNSALVGPYYSGFPKSQLVLGLTTSGNQYPPINTMLPIQFYLGMKMKYVRYETNSTITFTKVDTVSHLLSGFWGDVYNLKPSKPYSDNDSVPLTIRKGVFENIKYQIK